ncbi:MAG TPA: hypothetical protein DD670_19095 [Planctomycetaceae bacterium]|nr:hypothetical protein [Planctomycetaceae bacterium]
MAGQLDSHVLSASVTMAPYTNMLMAHFVPHGVDGVPRVSILGKRIADRRRDVVGRGTLRRLVRNGRALRGGRPVGRAGRTSGGRRPSHQNQAKQDACPNGRAVGALTARLGIAERKSFHVKPWQRRRVVSVVSVPPIGKIGEVADKPNPDRKGAGSPWVAWVAGVARPPLEFTFP